ncbi:hypothetical protein H6G97_37275 [Nostoc flagelliforme FACHB-838]|uniref:Uncharacterized protein n=1 Tax=Nostoc flagelliforme FACHB-838 TaxID=2692904 RepID=A0ABR8E2I7_9NOSO|nr:hypothetical protein [Nostoc flagelliforme]MBD2534808.1 hypothetical protein [Nostoc flagelliforme FACHB-838]
MSCSIRVLPCASIATWSQRFALPIDYCATNPPSTINVSPVMNDDDLSESYRVSE